MFNVQCAGASTVGPNMKYDGIYPVLQQPFTAHKKEFINKHRDTTSLYQAHKKTYIDQGQKLKRLLEKIPLINLNKY